MAAGTVQKSLHCKPAAIWAGAEAHNASKHYRKETLRDVDEHVC